MATAPSRPHAPRPGSAGESRGPGRPAASRPGAALRELDRRVHAALHHRKRNQAAGPPPNEAEVQRMVEEFHARGGAVTRCATAHLLPVNNGAGRDAERWTT